MDRFEWTISKKTAKYHFVGFDERIENFIDTMTDIYRERGCKVTVIYSISRKERIPCLTLVATGGKLPNSICFCQEIFDFFQKTATP